jgi:hypothetical protein
MSRKSVLAIAVAPGASSLAVAGALLAITGDAASAGKAPDPAADYCCSKGGTVQVRYPAFGTNDPSPLRLAGSLRLHQARRHRAVRRRGQCRPRLVSDTDTVDPVLQVCVFPDRSLIDAWGITYHSWGVVRGKDLTKVFRYRSANPPQLWR